MPSPCITPGFAPAFYGFPNVPGTYAAVLDMPEYDETGVLRIPYIYDPSGNSPFKVTVGVEVKAEVTV